MNNLTDKHIIDNSIFRIGDVVEVIGQSVKVKVDTGKNTSSILYKGDIIQNISVGGYVKIKKGFEIMIGKIEGETIKENKKDTEYSSNKEKVYRVLGIKILGFFEGEIFKRGIKELPLIDNTCYLLTREEFKKIHDFLDDDDRPIDIGTLEYDDFQKIKLGINKLFASHIGIFGNTGSGKSYTLAKIYRQLFKKYKDNTNFQEKAQFFLIDFNGEYIHDNVIVEKKYKDVYKLTTKRLTANDNRDKFPINEKTLNDTTFWSIFLEATEKTQMPFLNRAIKDTYIDEKLETEKLFIELLKSKIIQATSVSGKNIDRTIVQDFLYELSSYLNNKSLYDLAEYFKENLFGGNDNISFFLEEKETNNYSGAEGFLEKIDREFGKINSLFFLGGEKNISKVKKIGLKIIIKYYDEMIRGFSNREHLSPLIKRLDKRILDLEKVLVLKENGKEEKPNFTIISLRDVNLDIRKMLPMLLAKELYDNKKQNSDKNKSLHIIIDEAHNILSRSSDRESEQWKDYRLEVFEEIIKEGRKFGTFLTIASQRPSDISSTIISQLHNYFLHRLINNNDLLAVEKTIAYLDKVSADSIPNLATGTCILAGLIAQIPVVMKIGKMEEKKYGPQSDTIKLIYKWEQKEDYKIENQEKETETDNNEDISTDDIPF